MIVVANSSPLISLAKIKQFDLLRRIFSKIYIPKAVYQEVVEQGRNRPGSKETKNAKWIETKHVEDILAVQLLLPRIRAGEAESIVLAKELNAQLVLVDDDEARAIASLSGLSVKGTIGVLIIGYEKGYITNFKAVMDDLISKGFYISKQRYEEILNNVLRK